MCTTTDTGNVIREIPPGATATELHRIQQGEAATSGIADLCDQ